MSSNYPAIKLEPALFIYQDKIEHLSSYAHVVHTTAKQVISRRRENVNVLAKCQKMTNARARRAKILFFIVKYANLWRSRCCRSRGCVSSLLSCYGWSGSEDRNDVQLVSINMHLCTSRCLFDENKDILTNERWDWIKLKCQKKRKKTRYVLLLMPYWNFRVATCVIRFITIHEEKIQMDFVFLWLCSPFTCHKIICLFFKHRGEKAKASKANPKNTNQRNTNQKNTEL